MKSDFLCFVYRQGFIKRWNRMDCQTRSDINLHSHCFTVSIVSFLLAEINNHMFGANMNADRIAFEGLLHETAEGVSSDVPSPIKYASTSLRDEFKRIENEIEEICSQSLPDFLGKRLRSYIVQSEVAPRHKEIIKAADDIVAWYKCREEVEKADNVDFIDALDNLSGKVEKHRKTMPCVNWFLDNFNAGFTKTIDKLMEGNSDDVDRETHHGVKKSDNFICSNMQ